MALYDYDFIVIGSGAGGSIAAQLVAKAGKKVAIVEAGTFGGECPNYACVPTKALLQAASIYDAAKKGSRFGIRGTTLSYNYPSIKAWKDLAVHRTGTYLQEKLYSEQGISAIHGSAYFLDPHTITIGTVRLTAKNFLIATGSEVVLPSVSGLARSGFMTPREAVNLTRPPRSIAIIGGGASGCELAQLFAIFGSKVYLIESADELLSAADPQAGRILHERFEREYSMSVFTGTTLEEVEKLPGRKKLSLLSDGKSQTIMTDQILVTAGRKAVVDVGLENAGIDYQGGAIAVNSALRTSSPHIFAAGDATGIFPFTHTAMYQSRIVAYNVLHPRRGITASYTAVPRCIFTNPEVAIVGATEQLLKNQNRSYKAATVPINIVGRANIADFSDGFVKVLASSKTGILLGATIVCPSAGEMIHELTLAIANHMNVKHVANTIHAFPTWSEAIRVACSKLARN